MNALLLTAKRVLNHFRYGPHFTPAQNRELASLAAAVAAAEAISEDTRNAVTPDPACPVCEGSGFSGPLERCICTYGQPTTTTTRTHEPNS